jgi:hypothetical protein
MAGARVLPLVTAPTIANTRLHHVLIDGGASISVISYAAFKHLQIPESKLAPSRLPGGDHLSTRHIQDGGELPHRERTVRSCGSEPPIQCHHWQTGFIPVHGRCPLWVLGPQDAIPCRSSHRVG